VPRSNADWQRQVLQTIILRLRSCVPTPLAIELCKPRFGRLESDDGLGRRASRRPRPDAMRSPASPAVPSAGPGTRPATGAPRRPRKPREELMSPSPRASRGPDQRPEFRNQFLPDTRPEFRQGGHRTAGRQPSGAQSPGDDLRTGRESRNTCIRRCARGRYFPDFAGIPLAPRMRTSSDVRLARPFFLFLPSSLFLPFLMADDMAKFKRPHK
jgi:hypothetical protein